MPFSLSASRRATASALPPCGAGTTMRSAVPAGCASERPAVVSASGERRNARRFMPRCYTGRMTAQEVLPWLLLVQGAMGGFDTLLHHGLIEHLPRRPAARREIGLHSIRESIWAALLAG